jgi:hypothetical protein
LGVITVITIHSLAFVEPDVVRCRLTKGDRDFSFDCRISRSTDELRGSNIEGISEEDAWDLANLAEYRAFIKMFWKFVDGTGFDFPVQLEHDWPVEAPVRIKQYRSVQGTDELGNPEEFTSDGYLVLEHCKLAHLQNNGLPTVGTKIVPGMVLIAKFGATKSYSREKLPNDLESLTTEEEKLIQKYAGMFYDASVYAPECTRGRVSKAYFTEEGGKNVAVVEIECF